MSEIGDPQTPLLRLLFVFDDDAGEFVDMGYSIKSRLFRLILVGDEVERI